MTLTAEEALRQIVTWLHLNEPDLIVRIFDEVPTAREILASPSEAETKLRELQRLEGTED